MLGLYIALHVAGQQSLPRLQIDRRAAKCRLAGMDTLLVALAKVLGNDALLVALLLAGDRALGIHLGRRAVVEGYRRRTEVAPHRKALEVVVEQDAPQVGVALIDDAHHVVLLALQPVRR